MSNLLIPQLKSPSYCFDYYIVRNMNKEVSDTFDINDKAALSRFQTRILLGNLLMKCPVRWIRMKSIKAAVGAGSKGN